MRAASPVCPMSTLVVAADFYPSVRSMLKLLQARLVEKTALSRLRMRWVASASCDVTFNAASGSLEINGGKSK